MHNLTMAATILGEDEDDDQQSVMPDGEEDVDIRDRRQVAGLLDRMFSGYVDCFECKAKTFRPAGSKSPRFLCPECFLKQAFHSPCTPDDCDICIDLFATLQPRLKAEEAFKKGQSEAATKKAQPDTRSMFCKGPM